MPNDDDSANEMIPKPGQALGFDMEIVEHRGERVLTLQMIDRVHQRPDGTAGRNLRENRSRFLEGEDVYEVDQPDEIRRLGFQRPQGGLPSKVILLSESGYLMLVKSFTDDLAWEVQRRLVKSYFRKPTSALPAIPQDYVSALRLAADATEQAQRAKAELALAAPKVEAFDRIASTDGSLTSTEGAKTLGLPPRKFQSWLRMHRWTYRRVGTADDVAYQDKLDAGLMVHRTQVVNRLDGSEKVITRARLTPKGLAKIATILGVERRDVA